MKFSYIVIAAVIFCVACSKDRKTPNGFDVKVIREGKGEFAKPGESLVMTMLYKDAKDSIWDDTKKREMPIVVTIPDTSNMRNEKGLESVFRIMKKGDSVMIKVSARSFFQDTAGRPVPSNVKPEAELTFIFGVTDVLDAAGLQALQGKLQARQAEKNKKLMAAQVGLDTLAIDAYLEAKKISALRDPSGLRYVITKAGDGIRPTPSSVVTVNYKGSLLTTGEVFDQSQAPLEYPLAQFIEGWKIGFLLLHKGTKATFYIPSSLAYGPMGSPPRIPPNANLVFEVELIDFK